MPWLTDLIESLGAAIYVALFLYCVYKSGLLPPFAGVAAQQGLRNRIGLDVSAGGRYRGRRDPFFLGPPVWNRMGRALAQVLSSA